jgi:diadenosine tetraphosphatase ApaH/serine/threonine PP2A family protein phosphatase
MRIAIITDIHGNREALAAVLSAARLAGADRFVVLGDIVGYGPDPEFAVETVAGLADLGAVVIKGNHDEAAVIDHFKMTPTAREAMIWTKSRLGGDHRRYLEGLAISHRENGLLFVHASADAPEKWNYVNHRAEAGRCLAATDAQNVFCGHTHIPVHFHALPGQPPAPFIPLAGKPVPLSKLRRSVTVIGAAGQPRDGNPAACYGLLDTEARTLTMERVPYDSEETLRKIKEYRLPIWLGMRLQIGR